jgi:hypothetical protein
MNSDQTAGEPALRHTASTEIGAVTRELCGPYEEWRSTVLSFRKALAGLERLCDAASNALPDDDSKRAAAAAALIDKLVATAAADTDAVAQRIRSDADALVQRTRLEAEALVQEAIAESEALAERTRAEADTENLRVRAEAEAIAERARADAHADVTRMQGELQAERDRLRAMDEDLQAVRRARAQAEAAIEEAARAHQTAVAALESQVQSARAELDAERAEVAQLQKNIEAEKVARTKLIDALQTVQRAVSFSDPSAPASENAAAAAAVAVAAAAKAKAVVAETAEPAGNRPLKLISSKPQHSAEVERELTDYAKQLFEQIQSIYVSDSKATDDSATVVDRLTANLRHAHSVFARRLESSNLGESRVFEEQLALLLDTQSQTSFGRHLAIAAYSYAPGQRAEAS